MELPVTPVYCGVLAWYATVLPVATVVYCGALLTATVLYCAGGAAFELTTVLYCSGAGVLLVYCRGGAGVLLVYCSGGAGALVVAKEEVAVEEGGGGTKVV